MVVTWKPPIFKEEEVKKKFTWNPPELAAEVPEPIDLSKYMQEGYDEPTWTDVAYHSTKAGFGDLQSMMLNLGRLIYEGGVQITDKVTDIFDKDLYDPKKDKLRAWMGDLVAKSETIAEDSWEKVISKNRLKNFVALGGRAVPLSLITLLSGGALVGAHPMLAMKMGSLPAHMIPFGAASVGGHARRIEREFEARGQEAPYLAQLFGGVIGAMGEVATEAIPFQRWLNVYGGSRVINRGAKTFLAKYGRLGIEWATGAVTEVGQEVAMVPIEHAINNLIFDEGESLFPVPEMIQAGTAGLAMSLILGALGSSSSSIRSFSESKVDQMLKHDITRREGTLDIAEKVVEETAEGPMVTVEKKEYLPDIEVPVKPVDIGTLNALKRKGHNIARVKGLMTAGDEVSDRYRALAKSVTGKRSMKDMTKGEAEAFIDALNKLPGPSLKAKVSPQEQFVKKNIHKVIPKFPKSEYAITDTKSLWKLGDGIAKAVGIDPGRINWKLGTRIKGGITGRHKETKYGHDITIRLPKEPVMTMYPRRGDILGGQKRWPTHGTSVKVILHELGHIAVPPIEGYRKRIVHPPTFDKWTVDNVGKLWIETQTDTGIDKELQMQEIKIARICDKHGLDPKDFKFTTLPKGEIKISPIEEDTSEVMKELQKAGFGIEKPIDREPTAKELLKKIDDSKVKVHTMSKDEFVKRMMKNKALDEVDQNVANVTAKAIEEETPALPTPEGVTLSGKMQEYMKMLRSSLILDPSAKNVYDALAEMEGTVAEAEYVARQVRDTWETMITNEADEILIDRYMDMPEKYQAEITKKGLQNEADWAIRQYKRLGDVALEAGAIGGLWRNYAPYMFKNIHEWLKINKDANIPVTGVLGTKFAHGIERNLQNYDEAEAAGLIPEHRIGLKLSEYMYSLSKIMAHKNFIDTVRQMRDENGHAIATRLDSREEWARNYRQVSNPEFAQYVNVKTKQGRMRRVPIRWKPEVASAIEEIAVPAWMQSKPMRNIRMIKGIIKRIIFLNPAIHGWNIFSDVLDEVNFNFFEAWNAIKPGGKGARIYLDNTKLTRESLKANLNLAHTGRLGMRMREEIYDLVPIEGKNVITKGMGKLFAWNDNVLWTTIVRNAQMYTYALKRKQGLTPNQAAAFTNDLLGTLPKRYFTNFEWGVASSFFLARNWTISNLRLLTGAIGPMSNIIPIKALTRKEMSPADMQALAPHYIRHLIKGMFGLIILTNLLNKLFTGRWALENEPGHKMDVYTGMKDNKGREMYIVMPLLRYMRDYLGWITQPRKTIWNKMEPVLKTSAELLINRSLWQNRAIMHPDAPMPEKIKDAAEYALWSWTPFDQFLDSENEVKTTLQKMMYLTGTWVRRGSSISSHSFNTLRNDEKIEFVQTLNPKQVNELYGNLAVGRIYGEVAKKLYDFRSKKGYVKEKLDASIDKLLTGGDIPGAIELMVESGRYKDISAIKDRIMPYLMLRK